jgi:hypothetical protein
MRGDLRACGSGDVALIELCRPPLPNWDRHNSLSKSASVFSELCLEFLDNGFELRFIGRRYRFGTQLTDSVFESREHPRCSHASGEVFYTLVGVLSP